MSTTIRAVNLNWRDAWMQTIIAAWRDPSLFKELLASDTYRIKQLIAEHGGQYVMEGAVDLECIVVEAFDPTEGKYPSFQQAKLVLPLPKPPKDLSPTTIAAAESEFLKNLTDRIGVMGAGTC